MSKLYISHDLGTNSSGNIVSSQELLALESLGDNVIKLGYQDISPVMFNLPDNPFFIDYLAMDKIASLNLEDVDFCHLYGGPYTNTIRYLKARGIKTFLTMDAHDREESIKEFENLGYIYPYNHVKDDKLWKIYNGEIREADIVITPSKIAAEFLKKEGVDKAKIKIIPHGISIPENYRISSIPRPFNVGYLGAIGPDKGLKYLIQAWSYLNYQDGTLIIAGKGTEQLSSFIKKYATEGKYHLVGWIDNKEDFFKNISVYVQPSVTEAFGMEVLEAMSYGKTVIVSDGAGAVDVIEDGVNGFIVKKRDMSGIVDKLNHLKNIESNLTGIGTSARAISLKYDWKIIRHQYIDLWKNLSSINIINTNTNDTIDTNINITPAITNTSTNTTNNIMGIGISTINDYLLTDNLLTSIITNTNGIKDKDYTILVVDDGTQDINIISKLEDICQKHKVRLIRNNENRGVPYTWNKIVQNLNTELITIFNNDITVQESNWLKVIQYFLSKNDKIGMVGFPLLQREGKDGDIQHTTETFNEIMPKLVAAPSAGVFSFKKSVFDKAVNPDNSIGFYEDYISFLEETHFSFKLIELGYYNYMLNWPLMIHDVSSTFRKNPELWLRTVDWQKIEKEINGSKNEYIATIKNSKMYPEEYKIDSRIISTINGIEKVNRLQFSRYMFSKYWKIPYDDIFVDPNKYVIKTKIFDNSLSKEENLKIELKWLDKNLTNIGN